MAAYHQHQHSQDTQLTSTILITHNTFVCIFYVCVWKLSFFFFFFIQFLTSLYKLYLYSKLWSATFMADHKTAKEGQEIFYHGFKSGMLFSLLDVFKTHRCVGWEKFFVPLSCSTLRCNTELYSKVVIKKKNKKKTTNNKQTNKQNKIKNKTKQNKKQQKKNHHWYIVQVCWVCSQYSSACDAMCLCDREKD